MSKIFEALEQAHRARAHPDRMATVPRMDAMFSQQLQVNMEEEMLCLYKNMDTLLPDREKRIIQFIGSREGEGTSTVVREFAKLAATKIGKSVLLLDADRIKPSHHIHFGFDSQNGWQEAIADESLLDHACHQVEKSMLYVARSSNTSTYTPDIFNSPKFQNFQELIWEKFDLVLIDSPPIKSSPDALAIAPKTTGIVLVVEAESTRWRVIKATMNKINQVGGNILGVVLNKRRYYIPDFVYKRL